MDNQYMNDYMKRRYNQRRKDAIIYLGGVCVGCGSENSLHFHHKDQSTKSFTIARGSSFSDERFWAEIDKCVLLCADCHRKQHLSQYPCGTEQKYWRGCKCDDCKAAYSRYTQDYNRRRKEHLGSNI